MGHPGAGRSAVLNPDQWQVRGDGKPIVTGQVQRKSPRLAALEKRAAELREERRKIAEIQRLQALIAAETKRPKQWAICPRDGCLLAYSGENCPACQVRLLLRTEAA